VSGNILSASNNSTGTMQIYLTLNESHCHQQHGDIVKLTDKIIQK